MSAFAAHKLQEAVYNKLTADTDLNALVTAIYDEPPSGAVMPYIAQGDTSTALSDTKTEYGMSVTFTIEVWSDEASQMQTKEIMAVVDTVLHDQPLTIPGFHLSFLYHEKSTVERKTEETSVYHYGKLTYLARLYKTP